MNTYCPKTRISLISKASRRIAVSLLMILAISFEFKSLTAQNVGINTDGSSPDASAMLDVKATDRGLLIPRVSLTDVTVAAPVTSPATGLLVFNTNASVTGGSGTGFYYWDGTQWVKLMSGPLNVTADNGLTMTGNNIQLGGTLLQNTDIAQAGFDFRFTGSGSVGIGVTTTPSHKLHVAGDIRAENGFIANDGTAGLPAYRFNSTSTMGMFRAGTNELAFSTNSTERMRISANGLVGINTTTPTERLHMVGNLRLDGAFMPANNPGTSGSLLQSSGASVSPSWLAPGTMGQVLTINSSGLPSWQNANFWNLNGNAGTSPSTNFVGTTDNQALVIRTNNTEVFRFNTPGTSPGNWSIFRGAGGNTRGLHAVDLQSARSSATQVASGNYSVIAGGALNRASGISSVVSGGEENQSTHYYATVSGGRLNSATAEYAAIVGGGNNNAAGYASFIGGGASNSTTITANHSVVVGGQQNQTTGNVAFIGGGLLNQAGYNSAIPGGSRLILGSNSFGFSGSSLIPSTNLSSFSNIAAFVETDLWIYNRSNSARELRFYEPTSSSNGTADYTAFKAQFQTTNITYVLPSSLTPTNTVANGILQVDTNGYLSWLNPSAIGSSGNAWQISGNSGTSPSTNFLGTTDAVDLAIRTDNNERLRITSGGNVGIGLTSPSQRLVVNGNIGLQAGAAAFVGTLDNNRLELRVNNQNTLILNTPGTTAPAWSIQRDAGGNTRGLRAVDLQVDRNANTQVASGNHSTISGGRRNTASGDDAVVGGGLQNAATAMETTVSGGQENTASGNYAVISGGYQNQASGASSVICGGFQNQAINTTATVGGGALNTAGGNTSTIAGGSNNTALGIYGTIGGGVSNQVYGNTAGIFSGQSNVANGQYTFIGGGYNNLANPYASVISGGINNSAVGTATYSFIGGGSDNQNNGPYSVIGGGQSNFTDADYNTIGGGLGNETRYEGSTVGGGVNNICNAYYSTISGGEGNLLGGNLGTDYYNTIGGGYSNTINEGWSNGTIAGGIMNTIDASDAAIGGGAFNFVGSTWGSIAGGIYNSIGSGGIGASILGGYGNSANNMYSTILGGYNNIANGPYNLAYGYNVNPTVNESYRMYLFTPSFPGFLVLNRLDGDHPVHVGTNNTNGNGAYLTTGGTWTNGSSRTFKDRFRHLDAADVLGKIRQLPVEGWYYKGTEEYHIGPYAEDFYEAFGTGVHQIIETDSTGTLVRRPNPEVSRYLAASDVAGVALLGVKAVDEKTETLESRQSAVEHRQARLESRLEALLQEVERLKTENLQLKTQLNQLQGGGAVGEK